MYTRRYGLVRSKSELCCSHYSIRSGFVPLCAESVRERIGGPKAAGLFSRSLSHFARCGSGRRLALPPARLPLRCAGTYSSPLFRTALHCMCRSLPQCSVDAALHGGLECRSDANPRVLSVQASSPECHTLLMQLQSKVSEHVELCAVLQVASAVHAQALHAAAETKVARSKAEQSLAKRCSKSSVVWSAGHQRALEPLPAPPAARPAKSAWLQLRADRTNEERIV